MKRLLAVLAVCLCVNTANATAFTDWVMGLIAGPGKSYGSWICSSCTLSTAGGALDSGALAEITAWIYANNPDIHADERVGRWIPYSVITVCNGTQCVTMQYQARGYWLPLGPPFADKNAGKYKNKPQTSATPPGKLRIYLQNQGAEASPNGGWIMQFYQPYLPIPLAPVPAKVWKVIPGPITFNGPGPDYSTGLTDAISSEVGPGFPESFGVGGGGGGGGGCGAARSGCMPEHPL